MTTEALSISKHHSKEKSMKEYVKLFATWAFSIAGSIIVLAFATGDYRARTDVRFETLAKAVSELSDSFKRIETEGTRALQAHIVDNNRELKDLDRRVAHTEIIVESLSDLKADVREIKVRVGDLQERQKRYDDKAK